MSSTVFLNCPKYFLCLKRHIFINIFDEREQVIAERYIIWVEHNFKSSDINHWITRPHSEERISDFLDQKETTLNNLKNSMKLILAKLIQESYCENSRLLKKTDFEFLLRIVLHQCHQFMSIEDGKYC